MSVSSPVPRHSWERSGRMLATVRETAARDKTRDWTAVEGTPVPLARTWVEDARRGTSLFTPRMRKTSRCCFTRKRTS